MYSTKTKKSYLPCVNNGLLPNKLTLSLYIRVAAILVLMVTINLWTKMIILLVQDFQTMLVLSTYKLMVYPYLEELSVMI